MSAPPKRRRAKVSRTTKDNACVIPPALPKGDLHKLMFKYSEEEAQKIRDYVEWQARGEERVLHSEMLARERIMGRDHAVWDVHTDKGRWWVITNPTNLYSQELMPSMDYVLSFHVGLMARVASRRRLEGTEAEGELILIAARKLIQAGEALDHADEPEEFQAVAMRCRECLLALARELASALEVDGSDLKAGDFIGWSDRLANVVAAGDSSKSVRGYLKATAEKGWQLVNAMTHSTSTTRADAEFAWEITNHVTHNFAHAAMKLKSGAPDQCGRCRSYRVSLDWRPDIGREGAYVARCEACGAERLPAEESPETCA